ncbi:VPLPA-CTERM sorting domain-containing protein [Nitrospira lenta]|uniref:VPLPA-CTERM protein sorting domain-containing protein n=1 Tax=Nitrospira lenta TaxID=1436998 RepID=A0A330L2E8_9BACT|nr:VPLPA-CTERM sorting domain-containing protein [Nitrospira lenta]SPP63383.1 conserved exported hypothetical protein [Nitrospira lenta]
MNNRTSLFTGGLLGLGLLLAAGQPAHAVQAVWDGAYTQVGPHYAEWNAFNDNIPGGNIQDNTPDVSHIGGGNIYSPSSPTAFTLTAGNLGSGTSNVFLRVATVGAFDTTLNQSLTGFTLNGVSGAYSQLFNETITGGFGGNEVEGLVSWLGVTHTGSLNIAFHAIGSSVSLDQLSLDVAPVPLPAAVYLMGSGLAGIAAMARRRQRAV